MYKVQNIEAHDGFGWKRNECDDDEFYFLNLYFDCVIMYMFVYAKSLTIISTNSQNFEIWFMNKSWKLICDTYQCMSIVSRSRSKVNCQP